MADWLRKVVEGVLAKVAVGVVLAALPPLTLRCHVQEKVETAPPPARTGLAASEVVQQALLVAEPWVQVSVGALDPGRTAGDTPDVAAPPPGLEGYGGPFATRSIRSPAERAYEQEEEVVDVVQGVRETLPGHEWVKLDGP